jgi:hypothetical protein
VDRSQQHMTPVTNQGGDMLVKLHKGYQTSIQSESAAI